MARRYSDVERNNLKWFDSDTSVASLRKIQIRKGEVRGLKKIGFDFDYPITAIAGRNGCGKSTVIALAACAFHNEPDGWALPGRASNYYTFSDFFVQAHGETPIDGIEIWYQILCDQWLPSERLPDGSGRGWQDRVKRKGGKWSDYYKRVNRPVAFFGVERVVPAAERSVFRGYRRLFSVRERTGFEDAVCRSVSRVLGVSYDSFEFREHGKYRLPWTVRKRGAGYSGFNMGAGEKALFEFFATVYSAPRGALFLIDEIELGLHEQAQIGLVRVLSELCEERHIQVVCTTHSPVVLDGLPPEGRLFIEPIGSSVAVLQGVSSAYATGRMAGRNTREITIYLEDEVACSLMRAALPSDIRGRVNLCSVGSVSAVLTVMAARMKDSSLGESVAYLDGDQRHALGPLLKRFAGVTESGDLGIKWLGDRLRFIPGESAPESFMLSRLREVDAHVVGDAFGAEGISVLESIDRAILAGAHNEIAVLASELHLSKEVVWDGICKTVARAEPDLFANVVADLRARLA